MPGRVWDPAEVFLPDDLKSRGIKWGTILLERRQIALLPALIRASQSASKCGETVVHIDANAHPSGSQQTIDVFSAIQLLPEAMAISEGIDTYNKIKGVESILVLAEFRRQVMH